MNAFLYLQFICFPFFFCTSYLSYIAYAYDWQWRIFLQLQFNKWVFGDSDNRYVEREVNKWYDARVRLFKFFYEYHNTTRTIVLSASSDKQRSIYSVLSFSFIALYLMLFIIVSRKINKKKKKIFAILLLNIWMSKFIIHVKSRLKYLWSKIVYSHVLFANVTEQTILEEVVWFFFYNITNAYACIIANLFFSWC